MTSFPLMGEGSKATDEIDLSKMDWSDDAAEEPAAEGETNGDLSGMSWEDEEGEHEPQPGESVYRGLTAEEEEALENEERKTQYFGFVVFMGYILGGLLTGYFTRNRKLAVDYPPELLILLHTLWPIEWLFMLFAGKKVR
jgi:hypothetical protein